MPAIRTFARPSRTMHCAAAARIRVRASAAACARRVGSLGRCSAIDAPPRRRTLRLVEPVRTGPGFRACRDHPDRPGDRAVTCRDHRCCLTIQSVSDARLAPMTRQGSPARPRPGSASAPRPALDALFDPRSVTVLGASDDPSKWGHILSRRALGSADRRPALLVNRRGGDVLGHATHRTLADAREAYGEALDLVVVCVPAPHLVEAVSDAVTAGARSLVVITAGL